MHHAQALRTCKGISHGNVLAMTHTLSSQFHMQMQMYRSALSIWWAPGTARRTRKNVFLQFRTLQLGGLSALRKHLFVGISLRGDNVGNGHQTTPKNGRHRMPATFNFIIIFFIYSIHSRAPCGSGALILNIFIIISFEYRVSSTIWGCDDMMYGLHEWKHWEQLKKILIKFDQIQFWA